MDRTGDEAIKLPMMVDVEREVEGCTELGSPTSAVSEAAVGGEGEVNNFPGLYCGLPEMEFERPTEPVESSENDLRSHADAVVIHEGEESDAREGGGELKLNSIKSDALEASGDNGSLRSECNEAIEHTRSRLQRQKKI